LDLERRFGGEGAREYDGRIRSMLPGYEALHDTLRPLLRAELGEGRARVLVVGAGTGAEVVGLGEDNPGWRLTGVDPVADMLAIAEGRVRERGLADTEPAVCREDGAMNVRTSRRPAGGPRRRPSRGYWGAESKRPTHPSAQVSLWVADFMAGFPPNGLLLGFALG
jgi:SAM-dependent methyltransferase